MFWSVCLAFTALVEQPPVPANSPGLPDGRYLFREVAARANGARTLVRRNVSTAQTRQQNSNASSAHQRPCGLKSALRRSVARATTTLNTYVGWHHSKECSPAGRVPAEVAGKDAYAWSLDILQVWRISFVGRKINPSGFAVNIPCKSNASLFAAMHL